MNTPEFSPADQALLFANNDAVNAARLNNEISDAYYQAAQSDFDKISQGFAKASADQAGAKFDVQIRTTPDFVPGTDSDYITEVTSKNQIRQMQEDYNRRVNRFLEEGLGDKAPQARSDWHYELDVDFMADPTVIRNPQEFREIAEMNNDAYKNRFAAQYEKISRQKGGGVIGPEHVNGYMSEMDRFAAGKRGKIEQMLKRPASYFNTPARRAELFRLMAQEQKYVSRIESLDEFLRKQEGLPPRNRGVSAAKLGSNRSPGNAANTRAGSALAEVGRADALEDLAETMAQVARKNPGFDRHAADSIASVLEKLPPDRRASALARIHANGRSGLVDDILDASRRAGRLPPGSSLADDLARAGGSLDEAADIANKLDAFADAGGGRRAIGPAVGLLDSIGRAANSAEMVAVTGQLAGLLNELDRALDPSTPPDVAEALLEDIRARANELRDSAILGAIMERYPPVALIYGGLVVGCISGEIVSPSREAGELGEGSPATGSCLDRHATALQRLGDWLSGAEDNREQSREQICEKFRDAVAERRAVMKDDWTVEEACQWIRYGNPIDHMFDRNDSGPGETAGKEDGETSVPPPIGPESVAGDVQAEVERLLGIVRSTLSSGEGAHEKIAGLCARIADKPPESGEAASHNTDFLMTIRSATAHARDRTNRINEAVQTNRVLQTAVTRSSQRAREEADQACRLASADNADMEAVRQHALTARNHAVLASQVGGEANVKAEAALAPPDAGLLPRPGDLAARAAVDSPETDPICNAIDGISGERFITNSALVAGGTAQGQLAQVFGLLKHPNLPDKVDYTLQYASLQQRAEALLEASAAHDSCARRFLEIASVCSRLKAADGGSQMAAELEAYTIAHQEMRSAIDANRSVLQQTIEQVSDAMAEVGKDSDRARICLENAEERRNRIADDLSEYSNLSGMICAVSAIEARIMVLDSPRFSEAEGAGQLIGDLTVAANRLRTIQADLRRIKARLAAASKPEDVDAASDLISRTRLKLKDLPAGLDCGWLLDEINEASRKARERKSELEEPQETFGEAVDRCKGKYGSRFLKANRNSDGFSCRYCKDGYRARNGRCIPNQATANAWCEKNNKGSGWIAYNIKDDGSYGCRRTQAAANRWCNQNNDGSGWQAYGFNSKGGFKCRRPDTSNNRRVARAECRKKVRRDGKVYAFTQFYKDGSYKCRFCEPGFRYKNGRCHARQQTRQRKPERRQGGNGPLYLCTECGAGTIMGCTANATRRRYYSSWVVPGADCKRVR